MTRAGGLQAKTLALYNNLDKMTEQWASAGELAWWIVDNVGLSFLRAQRIVRNWASVRCLKVRTIVCGRTKFYCSRDRAAPDVEVLFHQYWGRLPDSFKKNRGYMTNLPKVERIQGALLAYGWFVLLRPDAAAAFNEWAAKHDVMKLEMKPE